MWIACYVADCLLCCEAHTHCPDRWLGFLSVLLVCFTIRRSSTPPTLTLPRCLPPRIHTYLASQPTHPARFRRARILSVSHPAALRVVCFMPPPLFHRSHSYTDTGRRGRETAMANSPRPRQPRTRPGPGPAENRSPVRKRRKRKRIEGRATLLDGRQSRHPRTP